MDLKSSSDPTIQKRITQAALAIFAENGYSGATMAQIAARAGVNPATIYRFFPGKRALFDALQRPDLDFPDQQERETRESILRAALALFSRGGYAATTMDEIAEEVGLSKAGVYFYFPSKENLFLAVMENPVAFEKIRVTLEQTLSAPVADLEQGLVQLAYAYLSFFREERFVATLRIILSEGVRSPVIARSFREKIVRHGAGQVAAYLQPFCALEQEVLERSVQMLFGMLFAWAITNLFLQESPLPELNLEPVAREHVQQFLYGLQPYRKDREQ